MAGTAVLSWLKERNEEKMIATFDRNLLPQFGVQALQDHRDASGKQHAILHELVKKGKAQVLQHLVEHHGFDMNVQRETDGCTPLHLAHWHRRPDIVDLLIRLGADTSVQNNYRESAADLMNLPAQIRARLQGARTVEEVLQLFRSEAASFDDLDKVTAYYRVAELSANYDVQFCRWNAAQNQLSPGDQESLQGLARVCVEALRVPAEDVASSLWPTMMRALAMLPDVQILQELLEMLTPEIVQTWSALNLYQVAWAMGKIRSTLQSRNIAISPPTQDAFLHIMQQLGNSLAPHVAEMSERNLAATVWAFGAAKVEQEEEVGHQALCDAIAADLETRGATLVSAQSISNIAWGFAKVGFSSPVAFGQLEEAAIRLVGTFQDQNVANTLWSFAKLQLGTANLFATLMMRAGFTLYEDRQRLHDSMSVTVKMIHWYQVYYAYRFCLRAHPGVIASLTERLARDLDRIHRGFPRDDSGLSIGSGLESAESLRELDQMIASSDQGDIPALPVDSMEAQPVDPEIAPIAAIATSRNDQVARNAMSSHSQLGFEEVKIVMLKYSRTSQMFRDALLEGDELRACRNALQEAGHQVVHDSGAKIFVRPQHYQAVCERIQADEMRLFTSHVLVAEEFEDLVKEAVANIPSTRRGQASSSELTITSDRLQSDLTVESRSTFLHIPGAPNSLYSGSLPRGTRSEIVGHGYIR